MRSHPQRPAGGPRDFVVETGAPGDEERVAWTPVAYDLTRTEAMIQVGACPTRARIIRVRHGSAQMEFDNYKPLAAAEEIEDEHRPERG